MDSLPLSRINKPLSLLPRSLILCLAFYRSYDNFYLSGGRTIVNRNFFTTSIDIFQSSELVEKFEISSFSLKESLR